MKYLRCWCVVPYGGQKNAVVNAVLLFMTNMPRPKSLQTWNGIKKGGKG